MKPGMFQPSRPFEYWILDTMPAVHDGQPVCRRVPSSAPCHWWSQDSNPAYQQLLQSELLGRPAAGSPERVASFRDTSGPGGGLGSPSHSPAKKLLRFQAGDRCAP